MVVIDRNTEASVIETIIEVVLECDHVLDHDYDNHPETIINLTNMATAMVSDGDVHLDDIRSMINDYLAGK